MADLLPGDAIAGAAWFLLPAIGFVANVDAEQVMVKQLRASGQPLPGQQGHYRYQSLDPVRSSLWPSTHEMHKYCLFLHLHSHGSVPQPE